MTIPLANAIWISYIAETLFYGVNTVVYPISLIILLSKGRWSRYKNKKMVAATSILYLLATLHFWLVMSAAYLATFYDYDVLTEAPENRAADVCASLAAFVGDLVLMHRLWILWGRKTKVIILPFIAAVLALIFLNVSFYLWAHYANDSSFPSRNATITFTVAFALSSFVNLFVTGLIIGRIWWMSRDIKRTSTGVNIIPRDHFSSVRTAMEVSVESGLLVAVIQVILVIFFPLQFVGFSTAAFIGAQIYAFAPMLVIVRVGLMGSSNRADAPTRNAISTIRFAPKEDEDEDEEPRSQTSGTGTSAEGDEKLQV